MKPDDPVAEPGARMKLIGGESGRYEHEELVDQVLLAPRRRGGRRPVRAPGQLAVEPKNPRCHVPGWTDRSQACRRSSNASVEPGTATRRTSSTTTRALAR
jgi:hypothetical protein